MTIGQICLVIDRFWSQVYTHAQKFSSVYLVGIWNYLKTAFCSKKVFLMNFSVFL